MSKALLCAVLALFALAVPAFAHDDDEATRSACLAAQSAADSATTACTAAEHACQGEESDQCAVPCRVKDCRFWRGGGRHPDHSRCVCRDPKV